MRLFDAAQTKSGRMMMARQDIRCIATTDGEIVQECIPMISSPNVSAVPEQRQLLFNSERRRANNGLPVGNATIWHNHKKQNTQLPHFGYFSWSCLKT